METLQGFNLFSNEYFVIFIGLSLFVPFWISLIYLGKNQINKG